MYQSREYLQRAGNCAILAEQADSAPAKNRHKRIEAAWRALAQEQQWLDGEVAPQRCAAQLVSAPSDARAAASSCPPL